MCHGDVVEQLPGALESCSIVVRCLCTAHFSQFEGLGENRQQRMRLPRDQTGREDDRMLVTAQNVTHRAGLANEISTANEILLGENRRPG